MEYDFENILKNFKENRFIKVKVHADTFGNGENFLMVEKPTDNRTVENNGISFQTFYNTVINEGSYAIGVTGAWNNISTDKTGLIMGLGGVKVYNYTYKETTTEEDTQENIFNKMMGRN